MPINILMKNFGAELKFEKIFRLSGIVLMSGHNIFLLQEEREPIKIVNKELSLYDLVSF